VLRIKAINSRCLHGGQQQGVLLRQEREVKVMVNSQERGMENAIDVGGGGNA